METLSGLTPALSRRLQKQLLAQLPPAAARSLRRTLSLQGATSSDTARTPLRSHSAADNNSDTTPTTDNEPKCDKAATPDLNILPPQYSTLPRPKRHSTASRESTPPATTSTDAGYDFSTKVITKDTNQSRGSSIRSTPDRPLLSKYLTPERTLSLDESYSSDSGSILSEPSYIAAYGTPTLSGLTGLGLRRHSMRLDTPRKRISRFLRPDFFDTPQDESVYAKHKKEKELETQEVLREIRERKNRGADAILSPRSPTESSNLQQILKEENNSTRKCLSPVGIISGKERSRSNTPFFPILDNIKESILDASQKCSDNKNEKENNAKPKISVTESSLNKESKLARPKSYPVKTEESFSQIKEPEKTDKKEIESSDVVKDSKLLRPKSYPASSPSPEKVYISRTIKRDKSMDTEVKQNSPQSEEKTDVEVTFSISLPKKKSKECEDEKIIDKPLNSNEKETVLTLQKYKVVENNTSEQATTVGQSQKIEKITNGKSVDTKKIETQIKEEPKVKSSEEQVPKITKKADKVSKQTNEVDMIEKKPTIKKKIIRKVSSKTKTDVGDNQDKTDNKVVEKKKVIKKLKEKINDDLQKSMEGKKEPVVKKKSVLQSLGQKFEKLTSTKSTLDKGKTDKSSTNAKSEPSKKEIAPKLPRNQREQSVPIQSDPPAESNNIKRAVTVTDVAVLDNPTTVSNKTTVSRVLGLFKKFDSKEKVNKTDVPKINPDSTMDTNSKPDKVTEIIQEKLESDCKPKRPTSLLLNGLGKSKYGRTASDGVSVISMPNCTSESTEKKDESKNLGNSLRLDFSRLPRVKKIVPTNPVIEPQVINTNSMDAEQLVKDNDKDPISNNEVRNIDIIERRIRSRSRSKSDNSNSDTKVERFSEDKDAEKYNNEIINHHPHRNHETTTPDKEDIIDRIRRKSFYSRFNEKRQRRKSNLVGPGATEYDPVARLHSQSTESKYDVSPTSPVNYDLSPGFSSSATSDLSPSSERYRSLITELPNTSRNNSRFDNYGIHDKIDSYRSLDRNNFRKYPSSRSYVDYDTPPTYGNRYTRTLSLLDSSDGTDEPSYLKEPHKYNRTLSLYAPGSYATYRPKRVRNSAIILKESEKEPSPENVLDKIKQKRISISVTRKPEPDKEPHNRSNTTSKSEGDGAERVEKAN